MFKSLFTLNGALKTNEKLALGLVGVVVILAIWTFLAYSQATTKPVYTTVSKTLPDLSLPEATRDSIIRVQETADSIAMANATEFETIYPILPPPIDVVKSYGPLISEDQLKKNTFKSLWLNLKGYFWALVIALPIGFLVGLLPLFNGMFNKPVDAMRYLPLTALTGVFMAWFGTDDQMKIAFLAFGILVYLLPVIIQRVREVNKVYLMTVFTLGATSWQTIRSVYIPSVLSRVSDDIRVLTAISWTYIIVAELVNSSNGGVGALIYLKGRFAQTDKVFAILMVIIIIGLLQDKYFTYLDKKLFPFKHKNEKGKSSIMSDTFRYIFDVLSVLYITIAIIPAGAEILKRLFNDGFYILLVLAIIEVSLELRTAWPKIMDKIQGNKAVPVAE